MECGRVVLKLWIVYTVVLQTSSTFCQNEPDLCSECRSLAFCQTEDENAVIPKRLPESTLVLNILYVGNKTATIGPRDFQRYLNLKEVTLLGRGIGALENGTFANLRHLKKLKLFGTSIKVIPQGLLSPKNFITVLDLHNNQLTTIPYHLFQFLENLEQLNLGFNNIILKNCSTIGKEFEKLHSLKMLELSGTAVRKECESEIPAEFFKPIQKTVQKLNLTIANFYNGSNKIFHNLTSLMELDISLAKGLLDCPSNASELFGYLPSSLRILVFRRWRTDSVMKPECAINNHTMAMLKRLQLYRLDMKYGDFIFGQTLRKDIFAGFSNLSELNIGYARFSVIEDYAFNDCPNLTFVTMDGNPLGARPFRLYQNHTFSKLKRLKMRRAHVYSDYSLIYNATQLILDSPLKVLDLRSNFLVSTPIFISNWTDKKKFESVQSIRLDFNFLKTFRGVGDLSAQCAYLENLKNFTATNNELYAIEGLCPSIVYLNLAFNQLFLYWDTQNQQVISQLHHLEILDLSYNQITSLSADLFSQMVNLTHLILQGNNLTHIADGSFHSNNFLKVLDLRANMFTSFNVTCIQHLHTLEELLVEDCDLNSVDRDLVDYLNASDNSITTFGIIGNPLLCRCDQEFFQKWIKETSKVPYSNQLVCSGPTETLRGQKVYEYKRDTYHCDYSEIVKVFFSVLGGTVVAVLLAVPCYKYRWYISHAGVVFRAVVNQLSSFRYEEICKYSAYVMYNSASEEDLNWVSECLLPAIERDDSQLEPNEKPLNLYIVDRDAPIGSNVFTEMISAMEKSRKVIIVLSNSYMKKSFCKGQADLAGRESYGRKFYQPNRVLVLVTEELDEEAIQSPFTSLLTENVINVHGCNDKRMERVWQRVRKFISQPKYEYACTRRSKPIKSDDIDLVDLSTNQDGEDVPLVV